MMKESDYWAFWTWFCIFGAIVCAFLDIDIAAWILVILACIYRHLFKKNLEIEENISALEEIFKERLEEDKDDEDKNEE